MTSNNNTVSVVPAAAEESLSTLQGATGLFADNVKALRDAKDEASFTTAWQHAVAAMGDTARLADTVSEAERFVLAGRAAIDAHVGYRLDIVGIRREHLPKESKADLARALYGTTDDPKVQNTREQMVGRDLKALQVLAAAGRKKVNLQEVLTVVNRATTAQMAEITARAAAGEPLAKDAAAAKEAKAAERAAKAAERAKAPVPAGEVTSMVASVIDTLGRVEHIDAATRKALLDALAKAESIVHGLAAEPVAPVETAETA
jgi:hypothetical protein